VKNLSAADVAAKWNTRANAATPDWVNGINATTTAPGPAAAAQADVWAQNTVAAKAKFVAALGTMSLSTWQQAAVAKGQSRYGPGITAGQAKYQAKIAKILAAEKTIVAGLPPRGNVQQNIQRSAAFQTAMNAAAEQGAFS
jgi:hypothetical protein